MRIAVTEQMELTGAASAAPSPATVSTVGSRQENDSLPCAQSADADEAVMRTGSGVAFWCSCAGSYSYGAAQQMTSPVWCALRYVARVIFGRRRRGASQTCGNGESSSQQQGQAMLGRGDGLSAHSATPASDKQPASSAQLLASLSAQHNGDIPDSTVDDGAAVEYGAPSDRRVSSASQRTFDLKAVAQAARQAADAVVVGKRSLHR
jgi:hypothetical protein